MKPRTINTDTKSESALPRAIPIEPLRAVNIGGTGKTDRTALVSLG